MDQYVLAIKVKKYFYSKKTKKDTISLTGKYGRQPASRVLAMESISWPLIPKSHSLIVDRETKILDGFTSRWIIFQRDLI